MTSTSEYIRSLAEKTPEEIQAIADECAEEEAKIAQEYQEQYDLGFNFVSARNDLALDIENWMEGGTDVKDAQHVLVAAFDLVLASQGYVLKAQVEKLF